VTRIHPCALAAVALSYAGDPVGDDKEDIMANPALSQKRFEQIAKEDEAGWAAPVALAHAEATGAPPPARVAHMTANGAFAKTFFLFLLVVAAGAVGWSQAPDPTTTISNGVVTQSINFPAWALIALFVGFGLALVCIFRPKTSPFLAPLYAVAEGLFLGVVSKAFEIQWDGIVLQAVLATVAVFFATLALYVFGVVKVTRKFQMVVIGATVGVFLLYMFSWILSLLGVDMVFWNEPSAFGIAFSVVVCVIASLNLFLDYEFISQASKAGAPKYMEWYGAFGLMVTLVWLYLEMLRLLAKLRN
jgi:uncharacterized YccA/Bax inhibitor family protein